MAPGRVDIALVGLILDADIASDRHQSGISVVSLPIPGSDVLYDNKASRKSSQMIQYMAYNSLLFDASETRDPAGGRAL